MPYLIETTGNDSRSVSKDFDPPIDARRHVFIDGSSPRPPEVDPTIPTKLRVGKPRVGGTPHILGWSHGPWIVSDRVREILEELEPGVHRSSSIELLCKTSGEPLDKYHLLLETPQIDCVDVERTEWARGNVGSLYSNSRLVLKGAAIKGRHLWKSTCPPLRQTYFVSDELRARLKLAGLDGWKLERMCRVIEVEPWTVNA